MGVAARNTGERPSLFLYDSTTASSAAWDSASVFTELSLLSNMLELFEDEKIVITGFARPQEIALDERFTIRRVYMMTA
jgi:hypothetical protein